MQKTNTRRFFRTVRAWSVLCIGAVALLLAACDSGSPTLPPVSTLTRPTSMAVAVIPVNPTPSELEIAASYPDSYLECLAKDRRAFGFVTNSGNDSVARIDLCTGLVESTKIKGNPFIVSHIRVGRFPVDVAVSLDDDNSRVFVANGGESSLSIIITREGRTLPDKVLLSGLPGRVLVAPSSEIPEGDVYVTLPDLGRVVRVVREQEGENERWVEDASASLVSDLSPRPLPGGMTLDPARKRLYVTDMASDHFHVVDLEAFEYPPRVRDVYGPQRDVAVSPDGRFLYLARLDQRRIAVYDLDLDRYLDTNADLPSHFNNPPPGPDVDYDIELQAIPRTVVFADVPKVIDKPDEDGDADEGVWIDGDEDDIPDEDGDTDEEPEVSEDEDPVEDDEADDARRILRRPFAGCEEDGDCDDSEDDPPDGEDDSEVIELPKNLYAYSIGFNGNVQVIDVHRNLHKLFDTAPDNPPQLGLIRRDELEIDNGMCLADIDVELTRGRTPDARWELRYNGLVPESDASVSGRFEADGRFVDPNVDFAVFKEILAASAIADLDAPGALAPDWLEITTKPLAATEKNLGCIEEVTTEDGKTVVQEIQSLKLEILEVNPDYLLVDTRGINLSRCFNTPVAYQIRAANNYLVYMTKLDSSGNRLEAPLYRGRAVNTPFRHGRVVEGEDQLASLAMARDDWRDYLCSYDVVSATGDPAKEYVFRSDMLLDNGDVVRGIRCLNAEDDGDTYWMSFVNDEIAFAVCQDDENAEMQLKQRGIFTYAFRTFSGVNEILLETEDGTVDRFVGRNPERALVMTAYPNYPRLYVVDSAEELVYVIDLTTDKVVTTIQ